MKKSVLAMAMLFHGVDASEWVIDESIGSYTLFGIGVGDATHAVAGTGSSGGAQPAFYNGSGWTLTYNSPSAAIMDMAALPGNTVSVYASFGGPFKSTDMGESWAHTSDVIDPVQSVQTLNGDTFALAGEFTSKEFGYFGGVIMSTDGKAENWTSFPIDGASYVRFGAYPSSTTWYITEGEWPATSGELNHVDSFVHAQPNLETGFSLSSRIHIGKGSKKRGSIGYVANIWKTTDGGKTFSKVFNSKPDDKFYFNGISCGSEESCVAVGDGDGLMTVAYNTQDGGATWKQVFDGGDKYVSLMPVKMTSELEGWIGPSGYQEGSKTDVVTDFYHTSDGGASWSLGQSLNDCISSDIESSDGLTISTCLSRHGEAHVAFYQ